MLFSLKRPRSPIQELLTGVTFPSPVMNVNTIPNPLQYFGSLLQLWIAGNTGVVNDGSGNAFSWADQSSYGHNLAEVSGITAPLIVASAQNGLAGVQANGGSMASNWLRTAYLASLDFMASTPFSVILVYKPASKSGATYDGEIGNLAYNVSSGQGWVCGLSSLKPNMRLINTKGTAECAVSSSIALTSGTAYIVQFVNTGTGLAAGLQIYVNGVLQTNTVLFDTLGGAVTQNATFGVATPACGTGGAVGIGASTVLEAAIVTKALSARDVAIMDAYMNAKWAVH